jgi:hypothetical protein
VTPERVAKLAAAALAGDAEAVRASRTDLHGLLATSGGVELAADVRSALETAAIELVAAHHREAAMSAGLPLPRARAALLRRLRALATVARADAPAAAMSLDRLLDGLVREGRLERIGDVLRDPGQERAVSGDLVTAMDRLEAALSVPAPPPLGEAAAAAGCPPEGVRTLATDGRIVRLGPDLAWSSREYHRLAAVALELARTRAITPAAFRDATGTSRKYVLAILEDLDRRGILQRTPEGHIPGPRAPRPGGARPQPVG